MVQPLKIAIVVHGRFHAFDMARELVGRGHDVTLLTNYPRFVVERFGVPRERTRSLVLHGILSRVAHRLQGMGLPFHPEAPLHRWFGRWAASQVGKEEWDVVLCWSGVGEETLRALRSSETLALCVRGSSHIRTQARLLAEEEARTGQAQGRPSRWMVAREEREYELAHAVLVNSTFARRTFVEEGVSPAKLETLPLAVDVEAFRPPRDVIDARQRRIEEGRPLRVLNVGTFSYQKGMHDMQQIIEGLPQEHFHFRFVGPVAAECRALVAALSAQATFVPKQPQYDLPRFYAQGDIFVLPTIQDGYAMVLDQAAAAGLPILTTTNSGGPDLIHEGETGWVLPIRQPEEFVERLAWCHAHREALSAMIEKIYGDFEPRDWADVAADFERLCVQCLAGRPAGQSG